MTGVQTCALPISTAVILGTARGVGETSPVLLTSGVTAVMNTNPFSGPMISLPLQVFDFVKSPEPNMIARGFGAAATLIFLVLLLFVIARLIGGKGPGQLNARQRRARAAGSVADLHRITRQNEIRSAVATAVVAPVGIDAPVPADRPVVATGEDDTSEPLQTASDITEVIDPASLDSPKDLS